MNLGVGGREQQLCARGGAGCGAARCCEESFSFRYQSVRWQICIIFKTLFKSSKKNTFFLIIKKKSISENWNFYILLNIVELSVMILN